MPYTLGNNIKHCGALFIFSAVSCYLIMLRGFPIGFDYEFQILTYEAMGTQILNGEAYPRWFNDVNSGFGGANFFYYPPLYYYLQFFIDVLSMHFLSTAQLMGVTASFVLFLSGVSFYILGLHITTPIKSLVASIVYMALPFHFWYEIYERNGMAELLSYVWIPLIYFTLLNLPKSKKYTCMYTILYSLTILTHIPTALITSMFAGICAIFLSTQISNKKSRLIFLSRFTYATSVGLGLSCFYLFPAVTMLEYVNSDYLWSNVFSYKNWFLTPYFEYDTPLPYLRVNLFFSSLILSIICGISILLSYKKLESTAVSKEVKFLFFIFLFCFFLTTSLSIMLWDNLYLLQKLQLPFRFLVIHEFLFVLILTKIYATPFFKLGIAKKALTYSLLTIATTFLFSGISMMDTSLPHLSKESISARIHLKNLTPEHVPKNKNYIVPIKEAKDLDNFKLIRVVQGDADTKLIDRKSRKITIVVTAQSEATIQIRQFHFEGWRLQDTSTGQDYTNTFALRDAKPHGQMEFDVPEGTHNISVTLVTLKEEKIGAYISAVSLIFLFAYVALMYFENKKRKP